MIIILVILTAYLPYMLKKTAIPTDKNLEPLDNPGQVTGFASPAEDYKEDRLHIVQKLVTDPTNTYYFEADNDELLGYGIKRGAILVCDRSRKISPGKIVVANYEQEWVIRKLIDINGKKYLVSSDDHHSAITVTEEIIFFGVVTWSCNPLSTYQPCSP